MSELSGVDFPPYLRKGRVMLGEGRQPLGHAGNEATSKGKTNTTKAELDNEHFHDVVG